MIRAGYAVVYSARNLSEQTNPTSPPNPMLLNGYSALASIQKKPRFGGAFELGGIPQALD